MDWVLSLLLFCLSSHAQIGFKAAATAEFRTSESRFDSEAKPMQFASAFLGLRYQQMVFGLEFAKSTAEEQSSGIFKVQTQQEKYLAWFHYLTDRIEFLQPYLGIGVGGYRDQAELSLGTQSANSKALWSDLWAVGFGVSFIAGPVWAGPEIRLQHISRSVYGTQVSGLFSLGVLF
jgi:hypothetical protein